MKTYETVFRNPRFAALLRPVEDKVLFYDDGLAVHGDKVKDDGIYSALYRKTQTPGEYQFTFVVEGTSNLHGQYRRVKTTSATVLLRKPVLTEFDLRILRRVRDGGTFQILVEPLGPFKVSLGPGYANRIKLYIPNAKPTSPLEDRLNGTYVQTFSAEDFREVKGGKLQLFETTIPVPEKALPVPGKRYRKE
jgi:hypothetical protein